MITEVIGDIFEAPAEVLVNPVNCYGVCGAGLAKAFVKKFPKNFVGYMDACKSMPRNIWPGTVFGVKDSSTGEYVTSPIVLNFATKDYWATPSDILYIKQGLEHLRYAIQNHGFKSIAIPALGCGCGGLEWKDVKKEIHTALGDLEDVNIMIYPPHDRPKKG